MSDIIQLLPDSVANQIAAGEVIQRPASAVKEILENAIDAGASKIYLGIKDSGKSLIKIIDNGSGMSGTDARMAFERHATSKIKNADDLFSIRTMGFRGEALASIAAIAQVELKTKKHDEETGTSLEIEGSVVTSQEICQCPAGTSISIKNLFYNVPARRNFLKSNSVEARHIIDEFDRVALAHPQIEFILDLNNAEHIQLPQGNLRQRIIAVFGNPYNEKLVPVEENTSLVNISGFVLKPEFARKTRGEQFFFVNKRFIKDPYLNHAVTGAFDELLPRDSYAGYFLFLDIDPKLIDINIHPTKTEVKFEDEKSLYAIMRASVKRALGQYNIAPILDFEREKTFDLPYAKMKEVPVAPTVQVNHHFNPFSERQNTEKKMTGAASWQKLYENLEKPVDQPSRVLFQQSETQEIFENVERESHACFQLQGKYIVTQNKNELIIIDQQRSHERILFEKFEKQLREKKNFSQQLLFPLTLSYTATDAIVINDLMPLLNECGFDVEDFGGNSFVLRGIPPEVESGSEKKIIDAILEEYKMNQQAFRLQFRESVCKALSKAAAIKYGRILSEEEMQHLFDELFVCEQPNYTADGKIIFTLMSTDEMSDRFKK